MAELIERQAAIKAAEHAYNEWNLAMAAADGQRQINRVFKMQELCKAVISVFENVHAADVAPVVHGRWEMRPTVMATDTGPEYKAYCTVCNEPNKQYQPPYCPHCGAKMDGGGDHEM